MLGYITLSGKGSADALLTSVAERLQDRGWRLAGAVQANEGQASDGRCHMDLHVLGTDQTVRISQDLGPQSSGCRLDVGALQTAVGLAESSVDGDPRLCIVNKFGKQEIDGKGFRSLIGQALARDIPVLCAVGPSHVPAFKEFAGDMATSVSPNLDAVLDWAETAVASATKA